MPCIGFRTKLPTNEDLKKIISDIMAEDSIEVKHFESHA